jgi:hypothetical protein
MQQKILTPITRAKEQSKATGVAIILNLSGHSIPENVFDKLNKDGFTKVVIYSDVVHYELGRPIGIQIEEIIEKLLNKEHLKTGLKATEVQGTAFFIPPAHSSCAILIYQCLEKLWGYALPMIITGIDKETPGVMHKMYGSPFNVKGFTGRYRTEKRMKYFLNGGSDLRVFN